MAGKSLIEWTDASWNPTVGCSVKSPGCENCYAMWLAYQFVPGVHEFIREFQVNWPDHRFDV